MGKYSKSILIFTIISLIALAFNGRIFGEEEGTTINVDKVVLDGKMWTGFDEGEKWVYLFGYEDGARDTAIHYVQKEDREKIYGNLPSLTGDNMSLEEIIGEIDTFYAQEDNLEIPINCALLVIRNRKNGVKEESIQEYLKDIRKSR